MPRPGHHRRGRCGQGKGGEIWSIFQRPLRQNWDTATASALASRAIMLVGEFVRVHSGRSSSRTNLITPSHSVYHVSNLRARV